ncbi:MAG: hypothetical protein ACK49R_03540 [Planctomycetota bacterium]
MKRRKRPDDPAVSLFPFLTVLICTIGVLIVLLVISVRAVGSKSEQVAAKAAEEQRAELARIQGELELHELRAEGWQEIRGKRVEQIRLAREERGYLEEALRELDAEAKEIAAQLRQLSSGAESDQTQKASETRLQELRDRLKSEQEKKIETPPGDEAAVMYNLVPFNGPGGTNRRPIYVECSEQKLVLQPWGIELQLADFAVPGEPGNPLDAALTTIKEYWRKYDLAGDQGAPYPLLVVRPSGAQSYALARRAMTSWVDEFGYELIPENKPLKYGQSDPQLAAEIRQAVEVARRNQALLAEQIQYRERVLQQRAISRQTATGSGGGGLRADRVRGGFTSDSRYASTHAQDGSGAAAVQKLLGNDSSGSKQNGSESVSAQAGNSSDAFLSKGKLGEQELSTGNGSGMGPAAAALTANSKANPAANQLHAPSAFNSSPQSPTSDSAQAYQPGNLAAQKGAATGQPGSTASPANKASGGPAGKTAQSTAAGEGGKAGLSSGTSPAPLAASRGNDWALPGRNSTRATPYLRPIRVICSGEELVIVTGSNSPLSSNVISFPAETAGAIEPLVSSLWRLIDSWGPTPDNGYWKPVLKVETLPEGESRARDLKALMQDSGIELSEEPRQ